MVHNNKEVLEYWNKPDVESMYDKHMLNAEIKLISSKIKEGSKILDAGCGEGEGTLAYAHLKNTQVHAVDFSQTRLDKAKERLANLSNVFLKQIDFLSSYELESDFDYIVSQRFLINLMEWELQQKVILDLVSHLKKGGRLLMLEGSQEGVDQLNEFRKAMDLQPIPVKWHNLFIKNENMSAFIHANHLKLVEEDGLGDYFLLTRGVRPSLDASLNWDVRFNERAAGQEVKVLLNFREKFSRLKLWVIEK